jgi:RNA polymerase sigma-70 factor (ECF subfamily)
MTARNAKYENRIPLARRLCNDADVTDLPESEDDARASRLSGHTGRPETGRRPSQEGRDVESHVFAAAARGDRSAFAELLHHYDRLLRLVVFRLVDDRDEMDDVMQEIAVKLYRTLPSLRAQAALSTWLYRAAYSTCIDHLRKRRPVDPYAPDELPESRLGAVMSDDPAELVAQAAGVEALLALLTPDQRVVATLVDQEGFDYARVSAIVGVPVGTVASRLNAARAVLRRALTAPQDEGERD